LIHIFALILLNTLLRLFAYGHGYHEKRQQRLYDRHIHCRSWAWHRRRAYGTPDLRTSWRASASVLGNVRVHLVIERKPLTPDVLLKRCDPSQFSFQTTVELDDAELLVGQTRARQAIGFGLAMDGDGYNVFVLGPPGVGRLHSVKQLILEETADYPPAGDWCYVHNFDQPNKPQALRLPAGRGRRFLGDMEQLIEELGAAIPAAFSSEHYQSQVEEFEAELKERQSKAVRELGKEARDDHIALIETPAGFAFAPMDAQHEVISPEEFSKLPPKDQTLLEKAVKELQDRLQKTLRQFPVWQKETREKIKTLNREIAEHAITHLIDALKPGYEDTANVLEYLEAVQSDIIQHVAEFLPQPPAPVLTVTDAQHRSAFNRFKVNLLVDNGANSAAPVVHEDLPNHGNLVGRLEHRAEMGTLIADFTLIKPGALHRANGGFLILDARKVLTQPFVWEALKRALESREIRIESLERSLGLISTVSLEPEPIPLELKVIMIGERRLYYLLCALDPEFDDLFKVAADFDDDMERNTDTQADYARLVATLGRHAKLRPLDRAAVARTIEEGGRIASDGEKLSIHLRRLSDLLREADHWAGVAGHDVIEREDVQKSVDHKIMRLDRVRERVHEEIRRGTFLIDTEGTMVGQVNGLSVLDLGNFAFGKPSRITATTRLGDGQVVDIERETELGGSIHSKGVLILSSFLGARYANDVPLCLSASLVFEQSYGMVEGDSASIAELCAILSALAQLPIRQSYAVTGSVNQHGQVQPIGGVNEKIEGFFDVCAALSPAGGNRVLIPSRNVKHLMLREDVVAAAETGRFGVHAIDTIDDAMELLTGVSAGQRDAQGVFPPDSVNGRVESRLLEYAAARREFGRETKERE
jgi:lon-related putative ATP-dependent protease